MDGGRVLESLTYSDRLATAKGMAEALQPCCEKELHIQLKQITATYRSFPVIKEVPCPSCRQIIPIRVYEKPSEAES